jgi:phosphoribosyl-AMP cyclohydrolase
MIRCIEADEVQETHMVVIFAERGEKQQIEEGADLAPKFDADGLIPVVATDAHTGRVLMLAWMNDEALRLTIETRHAHYYSRSRKKLWKKGEESGHVQHVEQLLVDCDQDALVMRVDMKGAAACHVGYPSCFYRAIPLGEEAGGPLRFVDAEKAFDPDEVYGKQGG